MKRRRFVSLLPVPFVAVAVLGGAKKAQANTIILDRQRVNTNARHNMAETILADNVEAMKIILERATNASGVSWDDIDIKVSLQTELSYDDGVTWIGGGGFAAEGGILFNPRTGLDSPASSITFPIPPGKNRRIRGWIDKTKGRRLRTFVTVETIP